METEAKSVAIKYVPMGTIELADRNPKQHAYDAIAASIQRFGFVSPLIMNESTNKLLAGHGRLLALRQLHDAGEAPPAKIEVAVGGDWLVPVVSGVSFDSVLSAEAYLVADNRLTDLGGWDNTVLIELLGEFEDVGIMGDVGYNDEDFSELLASIVDVDDTDLPCVDEDCSNIGDPGTVDTITDIEVPPLFKLVVECRDESVRAGLLRELQERGFRCKEG
jgi:hypothetical protein